ncbi:hypothetical protein F5Y18DRAFT_436375 [Xylariaceae sp. FL1019]|nr:hypothetical protein F5Y18DRAFT_436375 [Xylariaceae sp. FL1019]
MEPSATQTSDKSLSPETFDGIRSQDDDTSSCSDTRVTQDQTESESVQQATMPDKMTMTDLRSALPVVCDKLTSHASSMLSTALQSDLDDTPSDSSNVIDTPSEGESDDPSHNRDHDTLSGDNACDDASSEHVDGITVPENDEHEDDDKNDDDNDTSPPQDAADEQTLQAINEIVGSQWNNREASTRYKHVHVLMIHWEESELRSETGEIIEHYSWVFEHLYNYQVSAFEIPSQKPHRALLKRLAQLVEADSPETLFIIWYDGHGSEHPDRRGAPQWTCTGDINSPAVDSSVLATALADCESDILLIVNACCSLTCDRFNTKGVVECISASAFNTTTTGTLFPTDQTPSMTWAALRILKDKKCPEEGITVPELHRRICQGTQWAASNYYPDPNGIGGGLEWKYCDIRPQPVYTRLSADPAGHHGVARNIVLRKLFGGGPSWCLTFGDADINVKIRLSDRTQAIDRREWADWILSAPPGVSFACVEKAPPEPSAW